MNLHKNIQLKYKLIMKNRTNMLGFKILKINLQWKSWRLSELLESGRNHDNMFVSQVEGEELLFTCHCMCHQGLRGTWMVLCSWPTFLPCTETSCATHNRRMWEIYWFECWSFFLPLSQLWVATFPIDHRGTHGCAWWFR
jgi:hypothetical protein